MEELTRQAAQGNRRSALVPMPYADLRPHGEPISLLPKIDRPDTSALMRVFTRMTDPVEKPMDQETWTTSSAPEHMLSYVLGLRPSLSQNTLRLVALAMATPTRPKIKDPWALSALDAIEDLIFTSPRLLTGQDFKGWYDETSARFNMADADPSPDAYELWPYVLVRTVAAPGLESVDRWLGNFLPALRRPRIRLNDDPYPLAEDPVLAAAVRDVVDPFGTAVVWSECIVCQGSGDETSDGQGKCSGCAGRGRVPPPYLTHTAAELLRAARVPRPDRDGTLDPTLLLALADALEEGGCPATGEASLCCCGTPLDGSHDHDTCGPPLTETAPHPLLAHLRGPGPHYAGCGAVRLLEGTSI